MHLSAATRMPHSSIGRPLGAPMSLHVNPSHVYLFDQAGALLLAPAARGRGVQ